MITVPDFSKLLDSLERTESGARMARLSAQVKIEQAVLAEVMLNGNAVLSELDFYLEEKHRDLTVRTREPKGGIGRLLEWVEAKMCFSDCLARQLTGHRRSGEYCDLLRDDARKQERSIGNLPINDRSAVLSSMLLVLHRDEPVPRQKYYPNFRNRRNLAPRAIEAAALKYAEDQIAAAIGRPISERFALSLCDGCNLHVFVYRREEGIGSARAVTQ